MRRYGDFHIVDMTNMMMLVEKSNVHALRHHNNGSLCTQKQLEVQARDSGMVARRMSWVLACNSFHSMQNINMQKYIVYANKCMCCFPCLF